MHQDSAWKDLLESHLVEFMAFFFPGVHQGVDWARGFEFLDRELEMIAPGSDTGPRRVDKLVKVFVRPTGSESDGSGSPAEVWILVHVEVQGYREKSFDERMFVYHYRIFDRYRRDVVSLAVLTDDDPHWTPGRYSRERMGSSITFTFPVVKLERSMESQDSLQRSDNPFSLVALAFSRAKEAKGDRHRLEVKVALMRLFLEQGYARKDIIALLRLLEWILELPEDLQLEFNRDLEVQRGEKPMPILASFEKVALEKGKAEGKVEGKIEGKAEGKAEGLREGLLEGIELALNLCFAAAGLALLPRIRQVQELEGLRALKGSLLSARSLEEFEQSLPRESSAGPTAP